MQKKEILNYALRGLSQKEVQNRLEKEGYNEIPSTKKRSVFIIALEVLKEPMFLLLVACGTIYLLLGDVQEALILLGFVFVIMGITFYQERKTERALEALRDLSSPRASVIRDGQKIKIAGREVVRDDIIILSEGDRVPADAVILKSLNLSADESLLTGESVPVAKYAVENESFDMDTIRPGGDNQPYVFSGTLIVQGQAIAQVKKTGIHTEIGKIGKSLQVIEEEETLLKKDVSRTVKIVALTGAALCSLIVVVYGITRANWLQGFLAGLTLAMAMIPEEFPVVLTIFLSLGAWRISQKRVLTRRIPAVETLGAATVLCVDKTGTLTVNRMRVQKLATQGITCNVTSSDKFPEDDRFHQVIEYGILASQTDPFDPMEKAIRELGEQYLSNTEHIHQDWEMIQEYPLSRELLAMSRVWKRKNSEEYVVAAKGAPEAIADLCHLDPAKLVKLREDIEKLADDGLRVIGVARSTFHTGTLPDIQHEFAFNFIGIIGLADPIREQVPSAIKECYNAGMRVIMITGDYPGTAKNIAGQIGLANKDDIITGQELDKMSDEELQNKMKNVNVFARVVPEQKLRIVTVLKSSGEVVAMTGDGVNDAPALKAAHIGIAMGGRGTDVARESASLVLLDDDFMSIVAAVRMGRRIFDNLKKAISYILAIHVPIAGLSLLPVLLGWPLILFPIHIVFLELIIDPACSLVFEAENEEKNIMNRPPRNLKEPLFSWETVGYSLLQGIILLGAAIVLYIFVQQLGETVSQARTLAFTTLIIGNIGLILSNRSWTLFIPKLLRYKNTALIWVVSGAVIFMLLALFIPSLMKIFRFEPFHFRDMLMSVGAGLISIVCFELIKFIRNYNHSKYNNIVNSSF
ncbi:MAG: HAD-IC family P-type ATPase [Elusimicrobia bacterium]|nr:HAD-IC family P-type ATPase [Elusimicrobiota bacterium]